MTFPASEEVLECMEVRHHGTDSADSFDSAVDRRGTELALQPKLGLLAQRRSRTRRSDRFDPAASGKDLSVQ